MATAHARIDLHGRIVDELVGLGARRVLDLGCGSGILARRARGRCSVVGLDASTALLGDARIHGPVVRGDVAAVPFASASLDAVAAVHVLDHLPDPAPSLHEARRVLRPGGLLIVATTARADSPELAPDWRPSPTTFDAEDAASIVAGVFGSADAEHWDAPLVTLPDRNAVRDYLRARFVPVSAAGPTSDAIVSRTGVPLPITKRGALVRARTPRR